MNASKRLIKIESHSQGGETKLFFTKSKWYTICAIFSNPYRYILGYLFLAKLKKKNVKRNEEVVRCLKWRGWKNVRRKILKSKWTKKQPHGLRLQLTIPIEKPPTCEEREAKRIKKTFDSFHFIQRSNDRSHTWYTFESWNYIYMYVYIRACVCMRALTSNSTA